MAGHAQRGRVSPLYGSDGQPLASGNVVYDLPHWCTGVRYRADDDVCTLTIQIPVRTAVGVQTVEVNLEAHPPEMAALHAAIGRVLTASDRTGAILDVTPDPPPPTR